MERSCKLMGEIRFAWPKVLIENGSNHCEFVRVHEQMQGVFESVSSCFTQKYMSSGDYEVVETPYRRLLSFPGCDQCPLRAAVEQVIQK